MSDVAWLFDAGLRTVENASNADQLLDFMPEFYVNVCVDAYTALRTFFKLSHIQFSQLHSECLSLVATLIRFQGLYMYMCVHDPYTQHIIYSYPSQCYLALKLSLIYTQSDLIPISSSELRDASYILGFVAKCHTPYRFEMLMSGKF